MQKSKSSVDLWRFETAAKLQGKKCIAGVDEAGRGPLAGPVVAAAVVLPADFVENRITDSKKLTPAMREQLFLYLRKILTFPFPLDLWTLLVSIR